MKNKASAGIWICVIALILYWSMTIILNPIRVWTVIEIKGDHELVLSNGKSMYVENAYDEAFMVGTVFIIK